MSNHEFSMKVTAYGKTVTITQVEDAVDIHEFLDMCRALAIGIGYHEESWEDGVVQMADSYTTEDPQVQTLAEVLHDPEVNAYFNTR